MKKIWISIIGAAMMMVAPSMAQTPVLASVSVPSYSAAHYTVNEHIASVAPVCAANLKAVTQGDQQFLEKYIAYRHKNGGITVPEARRVVDACNLWGMGAAQLIDLTEGRISI